MQLKGGLVKFEGFFYLYYSLGEDTRLDWVPAYLDFLCIIDLVVNLVIGFDVERSKAGLQSPLLSILSRCNMGGNLTILHA
jgi:hypothetical protein